MASKLRRSRSPFSFAFFVRLFRSPFSFALFVRLFRSPFSFAFFVRPLRWPSGSQFAVLDGPCTAPQYVRVDDLSRRAFLAGGGAFAAAWLLAPADKLAEAGQYAARVARMQSPPPFLVLNADDAADLEAACSQILPSDETPGAREARVVYFIDKSLATWAKEQADPVREGIAMLRTRAVQLTANGMQAGAPAKSSARAFASLTDEQRHSIIAALEADHSPFFYNLRGATITGFLANPEYGGNYQKLGWKTIGFVDQFSWAAPFGWYDAHPDVHSDD
jgi:gluconate 2-dehydrogenase gamma chain